MYTYSSMRHQFETHSKHFSLLNSLFKSSSAHVLLHYNYFFVFSKLKNTTNVIKHVPHFQAYGKRNFHKRYPIFFSLIKREHNTINMTLRKYFQVSFWERNFKLYFVFHQREFYFNKKISVSSLSTSSLKRFILHRVSRNEKHEAFQRPLIHL